MIRGHLRALRLCSTSVPGPSQLAQQLLWRPGPERATTASRGAVLGAGVPCFSSRGGAAGQRWRSGSKRGSGRGERSPSARVCKGGSSGQWMRRHLKDPYVSAAAETGAPSRAAFKLVEINDRHSVLSPGDRVVDLGAAPGGWSMVASRIVHRSRFARRWEGVGGGRAWRAGSPPPFPPPLAPPPRDPGKGGRARLRRGGVTYEGKVVAVDLLEMEALPGVEIIRGDFRDSSVQVKILAALAEGGDRGQRREHCVEVHEGPGGTSSPRGGEGEGGGAHPEEMVKTQRRANVVLSDMAPSFSGDRDMDQGRVAALLLDALAACVGDEDLRLGGGTGSGDEQGQTVKAASGGGGGGGGGFLARGGTFLGKFLAGRDEKQLKDEAGRLFATVRVVKPPASRSSSSEMYLLATGFLEK